MVEHSNGAQTAGKSHNLTSIATLPPPSLPFSAVADIPGLVPGAHLNKGLGISFLRHVERCKSLMYILDASSSEQDLLTQLHILQNELDCYQPGMSQRAQLIVANKMDVLERADGEGLSSLAKATQLAVLPVSALHGWNIDILLKTLATDRES